MKDCNDWPNWSRLISSPGVQDYDGVMRRVAAVANIVRTRLPSDTPFDAAWESLGITVQKVDLPTSGGSRVINGRPTVFVSSRDDPNRQRFTAAHEVAHLLLSADVSLLDRCNVGYKEEEQLCDRFAADVLIDRQAMIRYLQENGLPHRPIDVLRMCKHFAVNIQPAIIALSDPLHDASQLILVARLRAHPKRREEIDYRIECTAGGNLVYLPKDQRLIALGLRRLSEWAALSGPRADGEGREDEARFRLYNRGGQPRSGYASGPISWSAHVHGIAQRRRYVLAVLTTDELARRWSRRVGDDSAR